MTRILSVALAFLIQIFTIPFKGAVLQRQTQGGGFFPGTNQTGRVSFGP